MDLSSRSASAQNRQVLVSKSDRDTCDIPRTAPKRRINGVRKKRKVVLEIDHREITVFAGAVAGTPESSGNVSGVRRHGIFDSRRGTGGAEVYARTSGVGHFRNGRAFRPHVFGRMVDLSRFA